VGERAFEAPLRGLEPLRGAGGLLVEATRQVLDPPLDAVSVLDDVPDSRFAEDRPLGGAQPPQPDREDRGEEERHQREGAGREGDDSRSGGQLIHGREKDR
jgi:hypothetical protein